MRDAIQEMRMLGVGRHATLDRLEEGDDFKDLSQDEQRKLVAAVRRTIRTAQKNGQTAKLYRVLFARDQLIPKENQ